VNIHRLLYSSYCFLNTNTSIMRQLIRTARTLKAEWWQFCGEAWVRGHRKMSQVLGAFGLLDFTMLPSVLIWRAFWDVLTFYFFNFPNFISGRGRPRIVRSTYTGYPNKVTTIPGLPYTRRDASLWLGQYLRILNRRWGCDWNITKGEKRSVSWLCDVATGVGIVPTRYEMFGEKWYHP
jgi:hypothetical protein